MKHYDYLILGGGIVGLSLARQLLISDPRASIAVLEKEPALGCHSSGRNSGVLHSGIYYPQGSNKARFCVSGMKRMMDYCLEKNVPIKKIGKVILPTQADDDPQVDILYKRGVANGCSVEIIDASQLKEIEPSSYSATGRALYSPETSIVDPKQVLASIKEDLHSKGVDIILSSKVRNITMKDSQVCTDNNRFAYGHLYNAAGQYADLFAHQCGVGLQYTLLPFKGRYYELSSASSLRLNGLVYPVPDLKVPFLGVHSVTNLQGQVFFGPTATLAFGRENYYGLNGVDLSEAAGAIQAALQLYSHNHQNFRELMKREIKLFSKSYFLNVVRQLVPEVSYEHLKTSRKAGIRPQLYDRAAKQLVMDFVVDTKNNTTHILNSISPAFTSAFSFAEHVVDSSLGS